jgi:hypothetical protein
MKKLTDIITSIVDKNTIQADQTIRILEYSLLRLRAERDTGHAFLYRNIKNPIISRYLVYRNNGLIGTDDTADSVIGHIVNYYRSNLQGREK